LTLLDEGSYILVGAVGFLVLDNNKIEFYFCAMYQQRQLAPALRQAISGFPAILLTGPRQSGKTTFLRHEAGEQADYSSFDDPLEREDVLWDGGYPIRAIHPDRRDLWLRSYISTYIERDVRQIRNIPDLRVFSQFLKLAAAHHSQEFHPADLSRELGITQPTVKSWGAYSKRLMLRTSCRHGFAAMANVW
jgi:predicted AAA+ superfamily ATPase